MGELLALIAYESQRTTMGGILILTRGIDSRAALFPALSPFFLSLTLNPPSLSSSQLVSRRLLSHSSRLLSPRIPPLVLSLRMLLPFIPFLSFSIPSMIGRRARPTSLHIVTPLLGTRLSSRSME